MDFGDVDSVILVDVSSFFKDFFLWFSMFLMDLIVSFYGFQSTSGSSFCDEVAEGHPIQPEKAKLCFPRDSKTLPSFAGLLKV